MTTHQYIIAWAVYLFGALGCLVVWWRMTRPLGQCFLRRFLRLCAAFAILTPAVSNPGMGYLGPALLVCLFDGLSHGPEAMFRSGQLVLVSLFIATLLAILGGLRHRNTKKSPPNTSDNGAKSARKEPVI